MWKILFESFDIVCTITWVIFLLINKIFFWLCIIFGRCLYILWFLLSLIGPFSRIIGISNIVFRNMYRTLKPFFRIISKYYKKLLGKVTESRVLKRPAFLIIIILVVFLIYLPGYRGKWNLTEQGMASYYGSGFFFNKTASTERYYPWCVSAASLTLPLGTIAKVVNRNSGLTVYVKINDRGPYVKGRILDLSFMAALRLGMIRHGLIPVDIYVKEK